MPRTKKPLHYPKKLRVALEKIADRNANADTPEENASSVFGRSFWSSFIRPKSVGLVSASLDEVLCTIQTAYHLEAPEIAERVTVPPPWERT